MTEDDLIDGLTALFWDNVNREIDKRRGKEILAWFALGCLRKIRENMKTCRMGW
jgi:hypothetical protein